MPIAESNRLFHLKNELLDLLFHHEERHLTQRALALIPKNAALGGSQDGFQHMGVVYSDLTGAARGRSSCPPLHQSLVPEMRAILEERQTLERERLQVGQAFTLVLRGCHSFQDIRDALPNGMHELIEGCKMLPRTREEGFTLADNERAQRQYQKLRDKVEFYMASKLLY